MIYFNWAFCFYFLGAVYLYSYNTYIHGIKAGAITWIFNTGSRAGFHYSGAPYILSMRGHDMAMAGERIDNISRSESLLCLHPFSSFFFFNFFLAFLLFGRAHHCASGKFDQLGQKFPQLLPNLVMRKYISFLITTWNEK